jgi:glycerate kinase
VAPDKFKGSLTAAQAAAAISRGIRAANSRADVTCIPMADGGEGTVDAFVDAGWSRVYARVRGPLGAPVDASLAIADVPDGPVAVVEMAAASGLARIPPDRRAPLRASTFGTGELVRTALDRGARRIVVALGGSATNDAGAGFLAALGVRLLDADDRPIADGGGGLERIARIDLSGLDPRVRDVVFEIAADVDAPLLGPYGASATFGPQKGASPAEVARLDAALGTFADAAAAALGRDVRDEPGTGAAGGLGFALRAFFDARARPGVAVVAELRGLSEALRGAAYCFTGEGAIDAQTAHGKTVAGVAKLARAAGVPTIAFAGRVDAAAEADLASRGILAIPIPDGPQTLETAQSAAAPLLERAASRATRLLALERA